MSGGKGRGERKELKKRVTSRRADRSQERDQAFELFLTFDLLSPFHAFALFFLPLSHLIQFPTQHVLYTKLYRFLQQLKLPFRCV